MGFINEYSSKVVHDSKAISLFKRYNEKNHPEIMYEYKKEFRFFKRAMATVQLDGLGVNVEILHSVNRDGSYGFNVKLVDCTKNLDSLDALSLLNDFNSNTVLYRMRILKNGEVQLYYSTEIENENDIIEASENIYKDFISITKNNEDFKAFVLLTKNK